MRGYETQRQAEVVRKEFEQARATAATQGKVVDAERSVDIADFAAKAAVKKAEGDASAKTRIAEADASVLKMVGAAEAEKTQKIGSAEASVIKQKVEATNAPSFVAIEVAKALAGSGQRLVPDIIAGGANGSGSTLVEVLVAKMLKDMTHQGAPTGSMQ